MSDSTDRMWASIGDDDADRYDRHGFTPDAPDDDDRPIMTVPLRPMPRPEPVILNTMPKHAAPPPVRSGGSGLWTPDMKPPLPPRRPS